MEKSIKKHFFYNVQKKNKPVIKNNQKLSESMNVRDKK